MKFEEETRCTVMKVYLDKNECKILERANDIIEDIWKKLDKEDDLDGSARIVYNAIDTIADSLEAIVENVYIE